MQQRGDLVALLHVGPKSHHMRQREEEHEHRAHASFDGIEEPDPNSPLTSGVNT